MSDLIERAFIKVHWFYTHIIREGDKDMAYYFTAFALSFLSFFYLHFFLEFVSHLADFDLLIIGRWGLTAMALLYTGLLVYLFFKKRKLFEAAITKGKPKNLLMDLLIYVFIAGGLFFSYYTTIYASSRP
jgi:hypothetical protein